MYLLYGVVLLAGAFPLMLTLNYIRQEHRLRKHGIRTTGVVSSIKTRTISKGPSIDTVTIDYNSNIIGYGHQSSIVTSRGKYKRGQTIIVRYLPDEPTKIVVGEKVGYWPMLVFTTILFLFVLYMIFQLSQTAH